MPLGNEQERAEIKSCFAIAKSEVEAFLQVTAVKSLQFAKHAEHWTESVFWILLLVGVTALAIRDVGKSCQDFINEETYTTMRVVGHQKLTFDDAIICVEYDPRALNLSDSRLVEHAEASKLGVDLAKRVNTSAVELLNRALKLLTAISLIEHGREKDYETKFRELHRMDDLQQLLDWLQTQEVDFSYLRRVVGVWLCNSASVMIEMISRGDPISAMNPCEFAKISWLGAIPFTSYTTTETAVCVDIGGQISFESAFDRVVISVVSTALHPLSFSSNQSGDYPSGIYLDFSGSPVSTAITNDYVEFPSDGSCLSFRIGFGAKSFGLDRWSSRCNAVAKTRFACFADCDMRANANTRRANCTLFAWRYLYSRNRTMCLNVLTIEEQADSRRLAAKLNFSATCWTSCLFPCEYRQYDIVLDPEGCFRDDADDDAVSLELTPTRFRVPVFEEHFTPTVTELFSRIGGSCGLWLGVGMLGIFHALLFPVKLLLKLLQRSCSKQTSISGSMQVNEQI